MASLSDVLRVRVNEIRDGIIIRQEVLNGWLGRAARHLGPEQYEYLEDWHQVDVNEIWGREGQTVLLKRSVSIPESWKGFRVGLELLTGGEGLLSINGRPFHGVDDNRGYILLTPKAKGMEVYECLIEMKAGNAFEYVVNNAGRPFILTSARLIAIDRSVEGAYYDFKVVHDAAAAQKDPLLQEALLLAMKDSLHVVDFRDRSSTTFHSQLAESSELLKEKLGAIRFADNPGTMFHAGHSHIDVAWLWPLKETMRKVGRTYSTVAALMDEYPDYHFVCSQVPLFLYLKKYFPSVYEKVKSRVAEGRFEPVGGTWVENDCNVVSGESLVRQCLYGQRFFRDEFGVNIKVGWLPDVFGYSWAMPQIYRKSGLDYFMTSKISWNDTNRFPHNTFWWQGVDGTKIFTHFIHGQYNAVLKPWEIAQFWENYKSKLTCPEFLSTFGYGDGGGGPNREMLEYLPRMADIPGMPKVCTGNTHDFFERIAEKGSDLPTWNGELYLEIHRGTYTNQARNKCYNRTSELLYREAEMFSIFSSLLGTEYPKAELVEGWHTILLNQFHDIIPGSSINGVYKDSLEQYRQLTVLGDGLRSKALNNLTARIDTNGEGIPVIVFNSLSWARTDIVSMDIEENGSVRVVGPDGKGVPCQLSHGLLTFVARDVPSCGYAVYRILAGASELSPFSIEGNVITTPYYKAVFGTDGTLHRLYDRTNEREVIPESARANVLQVFEDKPTEWEAWDIQLHYQDNVWEFTPVSSLKVLERGPARLVLEHKLNYRESTIVQRVVFYAHTPRIDFVNNVDWQERKTLLKVAFPVDILASQATYEIAYGAIQRPTHWNTSWDLARFEVSGHRWADLSEGNYGVSVLNDCKYGWDIKDNVIRLSLLRGTSNPDPEADKGQHQFTYSLFPHAGDWKDGTVREGQELNTPLQAVRTNAHRGPLDNVHSFVSIESRSAIIDAIKQSEDGEDMIVRVYEAHGARGPVKLTFDRPVLQAAECNLLEEDQETLEVKDGELKFHIKPFEIRTFRIRTSESSSVGSQQSAVSREEKQVR